MIKIPLQNGMVALIDDGDGQLVLKHHWTAHKGHLSVDNWYADTHVKREDGSRTTLAMHRLILGVSRVDHKDGNGLNNQRHNLRPATHGQNMQNKVKHGIRSGKKCSSKFKGVWLWSKYYLAKPWVSQIRVNKQIIRLGYHATEELAARAYDEAALKYHGEFANLNFPKET